jgi:hypothetical protein
MEGIPESLAEVLRRYDVLKLGVAVADDGKKVSQTRYPDMDYI